MKLRVGAVLLGATATALVLVSPPADAVPVISHSVWLSPQPVVGGTLSDSSSQPSFRINDGAKFTSSTGICEAHFDLIRYAHAGDLESGGRAWTAPTASLGPSVKTLT